MRGQLSVLGSHLRYRRQGTAIAVILVRQIAQAFLTFFDPFTVLFFLGISVAVCCTNRLMLEITHLRRLGDSGATKRLSGRTTVIRFSAEPSVSCVARGEGCFRVFFGTGLVVFGAEPVF
jgi:hypothetical protein